jgi:hypothetical protein
MFGFVVIVEAELLGYVHGDVSANPESSSVSGCPPRHHE